MTTVGAAGSALSAQNIWNRFLSGLDKNGDGSLGVEELAALSSPDKAEQALKAHDANGDGQLTSDELPKGAFSTPVMAGLLSAQEYRDASPDARRADDKAAIAAMFARADVNGDGVLSQQEWDAERTLNKSHFADTGQMPDIAFIAHVASRNGLTTVGEEAPADSGLRPEDFLVGRRVPLETVPVADLPADWNDRLADLRRADGQSSTQDKPLKILDPATVRADMMAEVKSTPISATFLTRLIMSLGEGGAATS